MALRDRDANAKTAKRSHDTVDLTQSDDEQPARKEPRYAPRNDIPTPPSSFSASQNGQNGYTTSAQSRPFSNGFGFDSSPRFGEPLASQQHSDAERERWLQSTPAEDDEQDLGDITSTQPGSDGADNADNFVHYGDLDARIVGVRFYNGFATVQERVLLRREPGNPYDRNAIRIDNVNYKQIGHLKKQQAAKLARYIDNKWAVLEATLSGNIGQFDCPTNIAIFGPPINSDAGRQLIDRLKADKLPLNGVKAFEKQEKAKLTEQRKQAAKKGNASANGWKNTHEDGDGSGEQPMDDILEASERISPREMGRSVDKYRADEEQLAAMPKATQPKRIKTEMLPYQLQALQWLQEHEHPKLPATGSDQAVQLWRRHETDSRAFTNIASNYSVKDSEPKLASGGILADDMGLGKTLEMTALMIAEMGNSEGVPKQSIEATLIVSPLSVMSNWRDQIARHVDDKNPLRVYTFHGSGKKPMSRKDFEQYDVVITTYQTLALDFAASTDAPGKRSKGLYSVNWRRIILDEGHMIRNPQSKIAVAATAVAAHSRWVLSGTPIINSLKDLFSIVKFIGLTGGLEQLEIFNSALVRPLKAGDESAAYLLQAIMASICLRRRKEMKFVDLRLPELAEYVHRVKFAEFEREKYKGLSDEAKGMLKDFQSANSGDAATKYRHLLEILLRMRQVCNHWQLCADRVTKLMKVLEEQKTIRLTPENRKALQDLLQLSIESREDCPICLDNHSPVITNCGHAFGLECITHIIETQHKCPLCRAELQDDSCLVYPSNDYGDAEATSEQTSSEESSSKLDALFHILNASKASNKKTVVFSQWTSFLDIIQPRLEKEGYVFCRLDGTMSATKRDDALHRFDNDDKCTILLASLGVCSVGLNLVVASQVILCDSWWAPAIEDQAIDRVHRLGQKNPTTVFRLVVEDSIEERTLDIQKDKRKLMMLAFSERSSKRDGGKAAHMKDIKRLLSIEEDASQDDSHDKNDKGKSAGKGKGTSTSKKKSKE